MSVDNERYLDSFDGETAYATPPSVDPLSSVLCSEMQTQHRKTFCTNAQAKKYPSKATCSLAFLATLRRNSKDKVQNIR